MEQNNRMMWKRIQKNNEADDDSPTALEIEGVIQRNTIDIVKA